MSFSLRRIFVQLDAETGRRINSDGSYPGETDNLHRMLYNEELILCIQVSTVNQDGTVSACPLPASGAYTALAAFGKEPNKPLLFKCDSASAINQAGDYLGDATANPVLGQLSFRLNTWTERFREVVFTSTRYQRLTAGALCELAILSTPAENEPRAVLGKFNFTAESRPDEDMAPPPPGTPDYLTATEVRTLFATPDEYQFSINGSSNWHTEQADNDRYFRARRANGTWGSAIRFPSTPATGTPGNLFFWIP